MSVFSFFLFFKQKKQNQFILKKKREYPIYSNLFKESLEFVSLLSNHCRGIFSRSDVNSVDFAGNR